MRLWIVGVALGQGAQEGPDVLLDFSVFEGIDGCVRLGEEG